MIDRIQRPLAIRPQTIVARPAKATTLRRASVAEDVSRTQHFWVYLLAVLLALVMLLLVALLGFFLVAWLAAPPGQGPGATAFDARGGQTYVVTTDQYGTTEWRAPGTAPPPAMPGGGAVGQGGLGQGDPRDGRAQVGQPSGGSGFLPANRPRRADPRGAPGRGPSDPGRGQSPAGIPMAAVGADGPPSHVEFVLDASSSMLARVDGGGTRIDMAKEMVARTMDSLPSGVATNVRVFGHRVPDAQKKESCQDSQVVVPFESGHEASQVLQQAPIRARGWTPLAANLQLAAKDLPNDGRRVAIVLLSDGRETCDGDPLAATLAVRSANPNLTIHTVGFGVDDESRRELQQIANAGGGVYEDTTTPGELARALQRLGKQVAGTTY